MTKRLASITPDARVQIYQILRAVFILLPALGVTLPGDLALWEQLILAALGLTGAAGTTLAIVHVPPNPARDDRPSE